MIEQKQQQQAIHEDRDKTTKELIETSKRIEALEKMVLEVEDVKKKVLGSS
jgi:hypothetical protein